MEKFEDVTSISSRSRPGAGGMPDVVWRQQPLCRVGLRMSKSDACMKALEMTENLQITEKSLRTKVVGGIRLYTLIEDGDDYIFDTKRKPKIVAKVGKDDTIILDTGADPVHV